jgi:hypothetical protein
MKYRFVLAASVFIASALNAQTTRDNAGIRITENARPLWSSGEHLTLGARPRLVMGSNADSAYRFRQVRGVMLLSDGRIAVADGASMQLRLFNAQGRFLCASAGKGTSTGQLDNMHWAQRLRGDTIAINSGFSTIALYSSNGQFVRAANFPPRVESPAMRMLLVTMLNSRLGVSTPLPRVTPRPLGTKWTDSLSLKVVTDTSDATRALGTFPHVELQQVASGPTSIWLSSIATFAASEDRFYVGFGNRYEVKVYTHDGTLQSIIRRAWKPTPITDDDWEHWVVEWSKLWVRSTGAERERDIQKVREDPWAEENPAFSQFLVDRTGRLWVREAHWQDAIAAGSLLDTPAIPSSWSVFDPRGRWLGDVTMPTGFKAFEIGGDYVIGVQRADGINQVVIYDLRARAQ